MSLSTKNLQEIFGNKIKFNEKLSKYNWFNSGGPAELFYKADNQVELASFLKHIKSFNKTINIIGAGSNTIIRDGGIKGVTIKLSSKFSYTNLLEENIIEAGAATLDKNVSNFSTEKSLSGLEFLSCIPGSVGGGVRMNSGCYGSDFSKVLFSIKVIDLNGDIKEIHKDKINFFYRGCSLSENLLILSAKFKGIPSKKKDIETKQRDFIERKKESQPKGVKTCGSTFKNPEGMKAWKLIKDSNSDKFFVGDVKISDKHCNFFINNGSASSFEIEKLINKVKENVLKATGKSLELEIKIIGDHL
tara:strand:+ start:589 stop:1497 length:909 start_codon:yes stop_codon:yes gene_type:complete